MRLSALVFAASLGTVANAETVDLNYLGPVDLAPFACSSTPRSSFVRHVCFDQQRALMLIQLEDRWYQYCGLYRVTVASLLQAPSIGQFYNRTIRGRYSCRSN
jgi:hypothetical protein